MKQHNITEQIAGPWFEKRRKGLMQVMHAVKHKKIKY